MPRCAPQTTYRRKVPKPPKKQFKLFTKHHDAKFVETRRTQLQAFMQGLCKVPAIERNLYLLEFMNKEPPAKRGDGVVSTAADMTCWPSDVVACIGFEYFCDVAIRD